jgi:hypothetical protein
MSLRLRNADEDPAVNVIARVLKWWRPESHVPSEDTLATPMLDHDLASEMELAAELVARADGRLDYTSVSVGVVAEKIASGSCSGVDLHRYGAYVGEVLRRNADGFAWGFPSRGPRTPSLALRKWMADPFELIDRYRRPSPHPEDTLVRSVDAMLAYAASPTEGSATALGWTTKFVSPTNGEALMDGWRRARRRWRRRRSRRA